MRFFTLFLGIIFIGKAFACESRLQSYEFECAHQDHYQKIEKDFLLYEMSPLKLRGFIIPQIVGRIEFIGQKNALLNRPLETLSTIGQYTIWKNTSKAINKLNPILIEVSDVIKLQSNLFAGKNFNELYKGQIGKLRTHNSVVNPTIKYSCEDEKINLALLELFENYDLQTEEGYPLLTIQNLVDCKDKKEVRSGTLVFYKNASVKSELNRWVVDFSDTLSRYEAGEALNIPPYRYLADMRRWFTAIAPFSVGNAQVAEALLLYATNKLHLPPIVENLEASSMLLGVEENRKNVLNRLNDSLKFFEGCLFENKTKLVSNECSLLPN
jgi:hypothetical protein